MGDCSFAGAVFGAESVLNNPALQRVILDKGLFATQKLVGDIIPKSVELLMKAGEKAPGVVESIIPGVMSSGWLNKENINKLNIQNYEAKKHLDNDDKVAAVETELSNLLANPGLLDDQLKKSTSLINQFMPNTSDILIGRAKVAADFLKSKLPPTMSRVSALQPNMLRELNTRDYSNYEKYMAYTLDPKIIFEEMKHGVLNKQAVEVLKSVYPEMYKHVILEVQSYMMDPKVTTTRQQRVAIGRLLGLTDSNIVKMQEIFRPKEEQPMPQNRTSAKENKRQDALYETPGNRLGKL